MFPQDLPVNNLLNTAAPELFVFTNHGVKHKKHYNWLISQFALKYHKNKTKKSKLNSTLCSNWEKKMTKYVVYKVFHLDGKDTIRLVIIISCSLVTL